MAAAVIFGLCAVWSLVTPLGATNDEGSQVLRAVSAARGQLLGTPLTPQNASTLPKSQQGLYTACQNVLKLYRLDFEAAGVSDKEVTKRNAALKCAAPFTIVTVPASFTTFPYNPCNGVDALPDSCATHLNGDTRPVRTITYMGRYPPLYYAVVGLPSLVWQTDGAVYAMRLLSGLLTSVLVGLAIATAWRWSRRLLLFAVMAACTPIVLVYGSAVNPSGVEMAAALCTWTALLALVIEHAEKPPAGLVATCATAAALLVLSRPLSLLWFIVMASSVALLRPKAVRMLATDHRARIGGAVVAVATLCTGAYMVWAKPLQVLPVGRIVSPAASVEEVTRTVAGFTGTWYDQFVGGFGWGLTSPPLIAVALLTFVLSSLLIVSLLTCDRRALVILLGLVAAAVLLPIAIVTFEAQHIGIVWQARYGFPLYCGAILFAGATARPPSIGTEVEQNGSFVSVRRRIAVLLAVCIAAVQFADLFWAVRRYNVGLAGPLNVFGHVPHGYSPPVSTALLVAAALGLCLAYAWLIVSIDRNREVDKVLAGQEVRFDAAESRQGEFLVGQLRNAGATQE